MNPQILIIPSPPTRGDAFTVKYTGTLPATLELEWDPPGAGPAEITIDSDAGIGLEAPANAINLTIVDPTGAAPDGATTFNP